MIQNNNLSVLPWYSEIEYQNHRKSYAYGAVYPLYSPAKKLLPFQIIRPTSAKFNPTVEVFDKNGNFIENISQKLVELGLRLKRFESLGYDIIVYNANLPFQTSMKEGQHYLKFNDGVNVYYSEIFTAVDDVNGYLSIEWWDVDDLVFDEGRVVYSEGFKNKVYICSEIGKPEYVFEEDGETRDGFFFAEKQISEKTYKFTFLAPEYLCDALRIVRMSDYIKVNNLNILYNCDTFLITPKWQTQGDLASVEVEFQTNTVVKKLGRGFVDTSSGDFNGDYINDFNNL